MVVTALAWVGEYLLAGRHLKRAGVPFSTMVVGGVLGIVGFFVIPIVGLIIGFIVGVFLAEWLRSRNPRTAWRSTIAALQATGLTILVELAGALLTTSAWIAGLLLT